MHSYTFSQNTLKIHKADSKIIGVILKKVGYDNVFGLFCSDLELEEIPITVFNLSNLRKLDFSQNNLTSVPRNIKID